MTRITNTGAGSAVELVVPEQGTILEEIIRPEDFLPLDGLSLPDLDALHLINVSRLNDGLRLNAQEFDPFSKHSARCSNNYRGLREALLRSSHIECALEEELSMQMKLSLQKERAMIDKVLQFIPLVEETLNRRLG